ncbi:hypothetical protein [Actinacidiphila rubida]|uniref:DUF8094 domain-containing protein n=1 Tax=Actinacidiphila rubida TaxID=310780 RepID=A0A1H8S504_9ACTN|nr:hypothetical protein [Actinacidiphila rubida]SEO73682.1 hypothetical protein SAMN05216267_103942 [Actinacidiphila rubida]
MEQFISRITRLTLTATATACLTLTAAACDSSTGTPAPGHTSARASTKPSPRPTATPTLNKQSALELIRHYSTVNNQANAHDNARLLDTVENDALFAMSVGGYKQDSGIPAKDRKPYKPWSYDANTAHLYIPKFAPGAQRWFAAGVTETGTTYQRLIVFAQQPDDTWQLVLAPDLDGMPLPDIALDAEGYATAVAADGSDQPGFDADRLRTGINDNFATGGKNSGSQFFTPTPAVRRQTGIHDKDVHRLGKKGTTAFASANNVWNDAYGLKTAEGGAVLLFAHTHTQTDTLAPGWQITPDAATRAWLGNTPRSAVTDTFVCNDAVLVPAPTSKAQLLGYTCGLTGADGPPAGNMIGM